MPVYYQTEWINSIVPVKKADRSPRLYLDPKGLNQNIEKNQYYTRTIGDFSTELHWSNYLNAEGCQVRLWMVQPENETSLLATFNTPWGKYRWLRQPFGLLVSSDILHDRLDAIIRTVPGVTGIADDVLAKGNDKTSHDIAVLSLL